MQNNDDTERSPFQLWTPLAIASEATDDQPEIEMETIEIDQSFPNQQHSQTENNVEDNHNNNETLINQNIPEQAPTNQNITPEINEENPMTNQSEITHMDTTSINIEEQTVPESLLNPSQNNSNLTNNQIPCQNETTHSTNNGEINTVNQHVQNPYKNNINTTSYFIHRHPETIQNPNNGYLNMENMHAPNPFLISRNTMQDITLPQNEITQTPNNRFIHTENLHALNTYQNYINTTNNIIFPTMKQPKTQPMGI